MKRLIVTGGRGFVAGSVIRQAGGDWEVHALARGETIPAAACTTWHVLDLLDSDRLRDVFHEVKPDAVIHAAAAADIDFCQKNRDAAEAVNVGVTRDIVCLCNEKNIRLVHLSTDTVFDGEKGMYSEEDAVNPVNFYGETKVKAENIVIEESGNAAVARLALVMGLPMLAAGNSFLSRMMTAFDEGREVGVPENEIRTAVDVVTLGRALLELAGNDFKGFIHLSGNDRVNRYEMSLRIADFLGFPRSLLVATNSNAMPGRAPRPPDVSMDNAKARSVLKTPMVGIIEGLELVLKNKL